MQARAATPADAPAITRIYNQGIEERIATFETRPRTPADAQEAPLTHRVLRMTQPQAMPDARRLAGSDQVLKPITFAPMSRVADAGDLEKLSPATQKAINSFADILSGPELGRAQLKILRQF